MPKDALVFKGAIGLKFVSDKSYYWMEEDNKYGRKGSKGFQLAYSINSKF